jgi:hypothetical protein
VDGEDGGGLGGDNGEVEARELHARADTLKAEYAELLEHFDQAAKSSRCVDSSLVFY